MFHLNLTVFNVKNYFLPNIKYEMVRREREREREKERERERWGNIKIKVKPAALFTVPTRYQGLSLKE